MILLRLNTEQQPLNKVQGLHFKLLGVISKVSTEGEERTLAVSVLYLIQGTPCFCLLFLSLSRTAAFMTEQTQTSVFLYPPTQYLYIRVVDFCILSSVALYCQQASVPLTAL